MLFSLSFKFLLFKLEQLALLPPKAAGQISERLSGLTTSRTRAFLETQLPLAVYSFPDLPTFFTPPSDSTTFRQGAFVLCLHDHSLPLAPEVLPNDSLASYSMNQAFRSFGLSFHSQPTRTFPYELPDRPIPTWVGLYFCVALSFGTRSPRTISNGYVNSSQPNPVIATQPSWSRHGSFSQQPRQENHS